LLGSSRDGARRRLLGSSGDRVPRAAGDPGRCPGGGIRRRQPRIDARQQALATICGHGRPQDRHPGQTGQPIVGEPVHAPGQLILRGQPRPEQQRIVGAEGYRHAGVEQLDQRHVGGCCRHAESDIRCRADLEGDLPLREPPDQSGLRRGRDAMADPVGVQLVDARSDAGCASQLTAVRHGEQAGSGRDPERGGKVGGGASPLVVRQAEPDHPAARMAGREPRGRPGVKGMPGPVRGEDHADTEAGGACRRRGRVEHQLDERGQPAKSARVSGRVDLVLQPAGALGNLVLRHLSDQPADVGFGAQHRPSAVIQPLEPEPAPLVGPAQPGRPVGPERVGQADPVRGREFDQGAPAHGPGEVQMQVRLGEQVQPPSHPTSLPGSGR